MGGISPYLRRSAWRYCQQFMCVFSLVLVLCCGIVYGSTVASPHTAYAYSIAQFATCSQATSVRPDARSLLIVLLDRSGSLGIGGSSGTDPHNYSASVTDALSDLWPGPMAVIPFYGNGDQLIVKTIGPLQPGQRTPLKEQVNALPANGWTPLAEAMQAAQDLLKRQGVSAGSRIVVITDGQPETPADPAGQTEERTVLNTYAPQFCQEGVPVSPFGLTIAANSDPARFLQNVATTTGGSYTPVASYQDLAGAVISLYAAWDGLEFKEIARDQAHGYYPVITDSSTQSAYILTFYASGQNEPLTTDNGQHVSYSLSSDERHYEIDTLDTPIPPATYAVRTSDAAAIVYVLDQSTRTLQLVQPTASTIAYPGQSITIAAHLIDQGKGPYIPARNAEIFFQATVVETVRGHAFPPATIDLSQSQPGSDLFTGTFAVPRDAAPGQNAVPIGTLAITVIANDQGVAHTIKPLMIQVVIPQYVAPPPPPCHKGFWQCASLRIQATIIGGSAALLFLLLLLLVGWFWRRQPVPSGTLSNIPKPRRGQTRPDPEDYATVRLGSKRSWQNRLLHRSVITSGELHRHPDAKGNFDFDLAHFEFVARRGSIDDGGGTRKHGSITYIRPIVGNLIDIKVKSGNDVLKVSGEIPLRNHSTILINGEPKISYS